MGRGLYVQDPVLRCISRKLRRVAVSRRGDRASLSQVSSTADPRPWTGNTKSNISKSRKTAIARKTGERSPSRSRLTCRSNMPGPLTRVANHSLIVLTCNPASAAAPAAAPLFVPSGRGDRLSFGRRVREDVESGSWRPLEDNGV
jgi:hypothetical protein